MPIRSSYRRHHFFRSGSESIFIYRGRGRQIWAVNYLASSGRQKLLPHPGQSLGAEYSDLSSYKRGVACLQNFDHLIDVRTWHKLDMMMTGCRVQVFFDPKPIFDLCDKTFAEGRIGLWTKWDAITYFDDLKLQLAQWLVLLDAKIHDHATTRSSGDSAVSSWVREDLPQGRPQQIQGKGLLNKSRCALVQRLFFNLLWAVSTKHDDR